MQEGAAHEGEAVREVDVFFKAVDVRVGVAVEAVVRGDGVWLDADVGKGDYVHLQMLLILKGREAYRVRVGGARVVRWRLVLVFFLTIKRLS